MEFSGVRLELSGVRLEINWRSLDRDWMEISTILQLNANNRKMEFTWSLVGVNLELGGVPLEFVL